MRLNYFSNYFDKNSSTKAEHLKMRPHGFALLLAIMWYYLDMILEMMLLHLKE